MIQINSSAPIIPSIRVSISVALRSRRMAGSFGAALAAPGAVEVMLSPSTLFSLDTAAGGAGVVSVKRKPRRRENGAARLFYSASDAVNSLAIRGHLRLHACADFRLGDPSLVDDHVEVVLGDGERRQQDAIDLDALCAAREGLHAGNVRLLLALCERDGRLARRLAEVAAVFPDV